MATLYEENGYYRSVGTLRYSPKRLARQFKRQRSENWWIVIDCNPSIGKYWRHLYNLQHYKCEKLQASYWGPHASISRNELPPAEFHHLWEKYAGEEIEFWYYPGVKDTTGYLGSRQYYWLDVKCPKALDIREELGLPREPRTAFHLTIGNKDL